MPKTTVSCLLWLNLQHTQFSFTEKGIGREPPCLPSTCIYARPGCFSQWGNCFSFRVGPLPTMCTRVATSGLLKSIALLTIPLILNYQLFPSLLKHSHPYTNILYYLPSQSKHISPGMIPFIYIASLLRRAVTLRALLSYYPLMLSPTSIRYFFHTAHLNLPLPVLCPHVIWPLMRNNQQALLLMHLFGLVFRTSSAWTLFRYLSYEHNINSCSHAIYVEWENINKCKGETFGDQCCDENRVWGWKRSVSGYSFKQEN